MRQRLHIKLVPLKGSDFVNEFYDEMTGKLLPESAIETIYNNKTLIASGTNVEIIKRGFSDGWMTFRHLERKFFGFQETKKNVPCTDNQLKKQLLQDIKYFYDDIVAQDRKLINSDVKVFCLNSEKFYAYVLRSDLEDLFKEIFPFFALTNKTASHTWEDTKLREIINSFDIPFRVKRMPTEVELHVIIRDIYLQCL